MPRYETRQPGNYYVTIHDGARFGFLAGPFRDDHQAASALVARCQELAIELDPWANSAVSVRRAPTMTRQTRPGILNARLGLPAEKGASA